MKQFKSLRLFSCLSNISHVCNCVSPPYMLPFVSQPLINAHNFPRDCFVFLTAVPFRDFSVFYLLLSVSVSCRTLREFVFAHQLSIISDARICFVEFGPHILQLEIIYLHSFFVWARYSSESQFWFRHKNFYFYFPIHPQDEHNIIYLPLLRRHVFFSSSVSCRRGFENTTFLFVEIVTEKK